MAALVSRASNTVLMKNFPGNSRSPASAMVFILPHFSVLLGAYPRTTGRTLLSSSLWDERVGDAGRVFAAFRGAVTSDGCDHDQV